MIFEPQSRILGYGILLEVHYYDTTAFSLGSNDGVEPDGPLSPVPPEWVDGGGIGHSEGEHGGALPTRLAEGDYVISPNRVKVAGTRNQVVDSPEYRQQIRLHRERIVELADPNLPHAQTPNGQIRIFQRLALSVCNVLR